jgi:hypothetical protein
MLNISKIDLGKLASALTRYQNKWVAISEENKIVSSGDTYKETVDRVSNPDKVVLLRVTPPDMSLAPWEG